MKNVETLDERVKLLTKSYPQIWPTEASVWAYIRGALRRGMWEKAPNKNNFKDNAVSKPPPDYKGRAKSGAECALTGEWTAKSSLEVDHINGHISLRCEDDVIPFMIHLLAVQTELQLVGKEPHKIKSYAERMGITFEEAIMEKKVIELTKRPKVQQDKELKALGLEFGSDRKRRDSWRKVLREEI